MSSRTNKDKRNPTPSSQGTIAGPGGAGHLLAMSVDPDRRRRGRRERGGDGRAELDEWAMLGLGAEVRPEMPDALTRPPIHPLADQLIERADRQAAGPHRWPTPNSRSPSVSSLTARSARWSAGVTTCSSRCGPVRSTRSISRTGRTRQSRCGCWSTASTPSPTPSTIKGVQTESLGTAGEPGRGAPLGPQPAALPGERVHHEDRARTGRPESSPSITWRRRRRIVSEFSDQIGLITLAFYDPPGGSRGQMFTRAGAAFSPGNPRARVRGGRQPEGRGPPALRRCRRSRPAALKAFGGLSRGMVWRGSSLGGRWPGS